MHSCRVGIPAKERTHDLQSAEELNIVQSRLGALGGSSLAKFL